MRKNNGENTDYITKNGDSNMERGVHSKSPANVTQYLSGVRFPCRKQNLIDHARRQGADAEVLERLRGLSEAEYHSMADVMKDFGEESASHGGSSARQAETRRQSHKDDGEMAGHGTRGGTHEQHVEAGRQSHKNR